jgi:hypothetical protein
MNYSVYATVTAFASKHVPTETIGATIEECVFFWSLPRGYHCDSLVQYRELWDICQTLMK